MSDAAKIPPANPGTPDDRSPPLSRESAILSIVEAILEREGRDDVSPAPSERLAAPPPEARASATNPSRVLLLCRSRRRCESLGAWIERSGHELIPRPDLEGVLVEIANDPPAVVVVPWHARDRRGRRSIDAIARALPEVPVRIIALCRTRRAARAAIENGAVDVIVRPFDARLIGHRVNAVMAAIRNEAELHEQRRELRTLRRQPEPVPSSRPGPEIDGPDDLTGLPQRGAVVRALRGALGSGASERRRIAVILFDIDRFRNVNHSLGRARGNVVLQEYAQRLAHAANPDRWESVGAGPISSMAARLSGDQFAVLFTGITQGIDLEAVLHGIRDKLNDDYDLPDGDRVHLTTSIGVAIAPDDGVNANELLQYAEFATGDATDSGGGVIRFHGATANPWTIRHARMANLLVGVMVRNELSIHYQPIVGARTGRIVAAEALLRWKSPELGNVSPAEFVPIAEERGLMGRFGAWVLNESCRRLREWVDDGVEPIRMAVNVSICQLVQEKFAVRVAAILEHHRIDPAYLELEISERGVLRDDPAVLEQLHELRRIGCRLAIDDFGTGNSAVAYLKRFPLTTLKIDRSFVSGIGTSDEDSVITNAITAMARQLQLTVVAEGVETVEQRRFLERCECAELQGFLFSPGVEATRFRALLDGPFESAPSPHS